MPLTFPNILSWLSSAFRSPRTLQVCEVTLLGTVEPTCIISQARYVGVPVNRLPALLPAGLECLTLRLYADESIDTTGELDELLDLWDAVQDCKRHLSSLLTFTIKSRQELSAPRTVGMFENIGVSFNVKREAESNLAMMMD